jgi:cysteine synthase
LKYGYRTNVNRVAGTLKDRLIWILITDDSFARKYLCSGTGIVDATAGSSGAADIGTVNQPLSISISS